MRRYRRLAAHLASSVHNACASVASGYEPFRSSAVDKEDVIGTPDDNSNGAAEESPSFAARMCARADGMDAELRRLYFVVVRKEQLFCAPRSFSVLPARFASSPPARRPRGTSSLILGPVLHLRSLLQAVPSREPDRRDGALAELPKDAAARRLAAAKELHQLNYYSTINLVPKRNVTHCLFAISWNALIGALNGCLCIPLHVVRASRRGGSVGRGVLTGVCSCASYLVAGFFLSPLIHIPNALVNSVAGVVNFFCGSMFFEPNSGRYFYCDMRLLDAAASDIIAEMREIKTVGVVEFHRKKMQGDSRVREQLKKMGLRFRDSMEARSLGNRKRTTKNGDDADDLRKDPYEVLQVKKSATLPQIKAQYKKLARVFHPDTVQAQKGSALSKGEQEEAEARFESIAEAYQILSNSEKRRAYDHGGQRGLKLQETKLGQLIGGSTGELIQWVFGGRAFRETLLGDLLKTHWELRVQHEISVSVSSHECLQAMRMMLLAQLLRDILDVHARGAAQGTDGGGAGDGKAERRGKPAGEFSGPKGAVGGAGGYSTPPGTATAAATSGQQQQQLSPEFVSRCSKFAKALGEACFGPALMYDIGRSYVTSAERFLRERPFFAPKLLTYRMVTSGIGRLFRGFRAQVQGKSQEELSRMVLAEWFNMEYDNVMADAATILRYAVQVVLQDVGVDEATRLRRCHALRYLGQELMRHGKPFGEGTADDSELTAYILQSASSVRNTGPPPVF